jgi:hypothetical protein
MSNKLQAANTLLAGVLLAGVLTAPCAAAGDLKVIANPQLQVSEISLDELRSVFLGTRTSLKQGGSVQPVLDRAGSNLNQFATSYLGKTITALETYYRSLVFTGKWSMPLAFSSDAEVVAYVARTRGAIAFVQEDTPADGVKTLKVK